MNRVYALYELCERRLPARIVEALKDRSPRRRALAGLFVQVLGESSQKAGVRELLRDEDPWVRLRTAQGLLASREIDSHTVRVLIDLLRQPGLELAWQTEELLRWVGGESSPDAVVGLARPAERERCRMAWLAWWRERGRKIEQDAIRKVGPTPRLVLGITGSRDERLTLFGCDGMERFRLPWEILKVNWVLREADKVEIRFSPNAPDSRTFELEYSRALKFVGADSSEIVLNVRRSVRYGEIATEGASSPHECRICERHFSTGMVWETVDGVSAFNAWAVFPLVRLGFDRPGWEAQPLDRDAYRLAQMRSRHLKVRQHALPWLAKLPPSEENWKAAIRALDEFDPLMRREAIGQVVRYRPKAKETVPHLLRLLDDTAKFDVGWIFKVEVRDYAADALGGVGPVAVPQSLATAENLKSSVAVRAGCAPGLARWSDGKDGRVLRAVRWAILHSEGYMRSKILWSLIDTHRGTNVLTDASRVKLKACLPEIMQVLDDDQVFVAQSFGGGIGLLGEDAVVVKPRLIAALKNKRMRHGASYALQGLAPKDPVVIRAVADQLRFAVNDKWGMNTLFSYLRTAGGGVKAVLPELLDVVETKDHWVSREGRIALDALDVIQRLGPAAKPATKRLRALLTKNDIPEAVRKAVEECLQQVTSQTEQAREKKTQPERGQIEK